MNSKITITVLCDNSVISPFGLIAEHGWAVLIETGTFRLLFDCGQGLAITRNSQILGLNLNHLNGIVLSHGHYDHCSGLPDVLGITGSTQVFCHPAVFRKRYWRDELHQQRFIGIRHRQEYLESLGAEFSWNRELREIAPSCYLTGEVPRMATFEPPDPFMQELTPTDEWRQDDLIDDQSLILDGPQGLIVILGCAHAGLINILTSIRKRFPDRPIDTVMGGTHLGFCNDLQFAATIQALEKFKIRTLAACHCTGPKRTAELARIFNDQYKFIGAGSHLVFESDQ